jgi:hypothetical protein
MLLELREIELRRVQHSVSRRDIALGTDLPSLRRGPPGRDADVLGVRLHELAAERTEPERAVTDTLVSAVAPRSVEAWRGHLPVISTAGPAVEMGVA